MKSVVFHSVYTVARSCKMYFISKRFPKIGNVLGKTKWNMIFCSYSAWGRENKIGIQYLNHVNMSYKHNTYVFIINTCNIMPGVKFYAYLFNHIIVYVLLSQSSFLFIFEFSTVK